MQLNFLILLILLYHVVGFQVLIRHQVEVVEQIIEKHLLRPGKLVEQDYQILGEQVEQRFLEALDQLVLVEHLLENPV
jgi:hypothetical protein